jgi:hypothetical protein
LDALIFLRFSSWTPSILSQIFTRPAGDPTRSLNFPESDTPSPPEGSSTTIDNTDAYDQYITRIKPVLVFVQLKSGNISAGNGQEQEAWAATRSMCLRAKNVARRSHVSAVLNKLQWKEGLGSSGERVIKFEGCVFALAALAAIMTLFC